MNVCGKYVGVVLATGLVIAVLAGCEKEAGPAERAGKAMDKAMDTAGRQVEKAGQAVQDAAEGGRK